MDQDAIKQWMSGVQGGLPIVLVFAYFCGFVIFNTFLWTYGVHEIELFKSTYLAAGALYLFVLASFALPVMRLAKSPRTQITPAAIEEWGGKRFARGKVWFAQNFKRLTVVPFLLVLFSSIDAAFLIGYWRPEIRRAGCDPRSLRS